MSDPVESHIGMSYQEAVRFLIKRIQATIAQHSAKLKEPIRMYIAGGTCLAQYVDERVTDDIDATFSRKIALPQDLEVAYRGPDGKARTLYFDYQYNDTFGLLHERAHEDSQPLTIPGVDPNIVDVRLLTPLDLAVSKLSRYSEVDQGDIAALASKKLLTSEELRVRAEEALLDYVGNIDWLRSTIDMACGQVDEAQSNNA